jgi:hypothetical protein
LPSPQPKNLNSTDQELAFFLLEGRASTPPKRGSKAKGEVSEKGILFQLQLSGKNRDDHNQKFYNSNRGEVGPIEPKI